jgi:ABC-type dipeptide/oligopeptide/nickel transport system permease subunit
VSVGAADILHETETVGQDAVDSQAVIAARSPMQLFWRRLREDRVALAGLAFIVLLILIAIFANLIVKIPGTDPYTQSTKVLDSFGSPTGPSSKHWFGVDPLGRDVFARVLYGARVSLEVALVATAISVSIGVVVGMVAAFYRGWVDTIISRLIDILLAFPILLLALGLASACSLGDGCLKTNAFGRDMLYVGLAVLLLALAWLGRKVYRVKLRGLDRSTVIGPLVVAAVIIVLGLVMWQVPGNTATLIKPGIGVVIFVIAFVNWTYIGRIIRGQVLSLREKEFVEAARSLGASNARIIFREILPNLIAPIIVYSTLVIPTNILFEAALSFLGVGVQPPQASWGQMLADATQIYDTAWWFMTFPGVALVLTVLAFNLLGDGLQDALNPRRGR